MSKLSQGIGVLSALCALASAPQAQDAAANPSESFICKSSNEVREINTYRYDAPQADAAGKRGCRVDYIRSGTTQTVWSSRTSRSFCDGKASKLVARLEASNFSCQRLHLGGPEAPAQ